jgi:hypothetical protein
MRDNRGQAQLRQLYLFDSANEGTHFLIESVDISKLDSSRCKSYESGPLGKSGLATAWMEIIRDDAKQKIYNRLSYRIVGTTIDY